MLECCASGLNTMIPQKVISCFSFVSGGPEQMLLLHVRRHACGKLGPIEQVFYLEYLCIYVNRIQGI